MYVTNQDSSNVSVIDTATNTVIATIPVGIIPIDIAYDSVNERMYVTNFKFLVPSGIDTVSVIDTATNTVIATIPVGTTPIGPVGIAYDTVNERIYVTARNINSVLILYLSANNVCQDSGFDAGELRTYQSNGQRLEQISCVNFVGECSGNIEDGETRECTVEDYIVSLDEVPTNGDGIGILANAINP
jgi:YVTN family beta-propeller protein